MSNTPKEILEHLISGQDLTEAAMTETVLQIMDGTWPPAQVAAFLTALRIKGETVEELTGAVRAMRAKATPVHVIGPVVLDTCGTGGDGASTFNISTTVAFVAAAAGIRVAKHGNRSVSSRSGSADVLEALGVRIDLTPQQVETCISKIHLGFLFAPAHHSAMRHAASVRKELGFRTLFNLVGPLTNPAGASHQLVGIFDPTRLEDVAEVLRRGGVRRAMIVHGSDGLDEVTLSGPTHAVEVINDTLQSREITPESVGLSRASTDQLVGGDADENAEILRNILNGTERGPKRDVVVINAGTALYVAEMTTSIEEGVRRAEELIDGGQALSVLERLIERTNAQESG